MDGIIAETSRVGLESEELSLLPKDHREGGFVFPAAAAFNTEDALIQLSEVCFCHGDSEVLRGLELGIHEQCRIGVIGNNGMGKSTFLRLVAGDLAPTGGEIKVQRGLKIAFIGQHDVDALSVLEETPLDHFS